MSIKAVIFDLDGTLLDTEKLISDCVIDAASGEGWTLDIEIVTECIGTTYEETERIVRKAMGPDFPYDKIRKMGEDRFRAHVEKNGIPLKNGVLRLLDCLEDAGIPFGIATTTHRKDVEEIPGFAGIINRFSTLVCGDEVGRGKPDPEIYHKAAGNMGVRAHEALVFEDSSHGITAAATAGARVVWIPDLQDIPEAVRSRCYVEIGSLDAVCDRLGELIT